MEQLPNEIILLIFDNIKLITDKRHFLKTCNKYNLITKQSFYNYEKNYKVKHFKKIERYCVEKFTLELCHDKYFEMIPERHIIADNIILIHALASFNCLPLLKLAKENGCNLFYVCKHAAFNGNIEILKWAKEIGCELTPQYIIYTIENGHLDALKWIQSNYKTGKFLITRLCDYSAFYGQLDILKWAHEFNYLWNENTCLLAASKNHLSCLKYARENGCDWDARVYLIAKGKGHTELLNWAIENGCPV